MLCASCAENDPDLASALAGFARPLQAGFSPPAPRSEAPASDLEEAALVRCGRCDDYLDEDTQSILCWTCRRRSEEETAKIAVEHQAIRAKLETEKRSSLFWGCVIAGLVAWFLFGGSGESDEQPTLGRIGATCEDGSSSDATSNGACSGHGGVDEWIYDDTSFDDGGGSGVGGQP